MVKPHLTTPFSPLLPIFVLEVWVSLSATGLWFDTHFLLGHGVIIRRPTSIASFRFFFSLLKYAKDSKLIL